MVTVLHKAQLRALQQMTVGQRVQPGEIYLVFTEPLEALGFALTLLKQRSVGA